MDNDPRCCGSGTCIIDADGRCWCGQHWDGKKMCLPAASSPASGGGGESTGHGKAEESVSSDGSGDGGGD